MSENRNAGQPKWMRDIGGLLSVKSQFLIHGNINDKSLVDVNGTSRALPSQAALMLKLREFDFDAIITWDFLDGLSLIWQRENDDQSERLDDAAIARTLGLEGVSPWAVTINAFPDIIKRLTIHNPLKIALIVEFTSRLMTDGRYDEPVKRIFSQAEKVGHVATLHTHNVEENELSIFNPIIWLANQISDIPFWFTADNNKLHSIQSTLPNTEMRRDFALNQLLSCQLWPETAEQISQELALLTSGMKNSDIENVIKLANDRNASPDEMEEVLLSYKLGDLDVTNPWKSNTLKDQINQADLQLSSRVKGQQKAITKVTDILKRTVIGLTGAHTNNAGERPRGVLFFAGPTGVGKTEMAKAITNLIFGDEGAYLRFDMSEFSAEHAADRLIGAPPGYVGYDNGGELTNAMKENPFRVVLFDEVEKAHPKILDKFLQILEDGRLTDGRGETVYFSDALIIFTSNAGISKQDSLGKTVYLVNADDPIDEFEKKVNEGIRHYFFNELRRPELLNRIGQNIVVFSFISKEVGVQILGIMLEQIKTTVLQELELTLTISEPAMQQLEEYCLSNLEYGGRGVGSNVENVLVNPLARFLFDHEKTSGDAVSIESISFESGIYSVQCQ